MLLCTLVRHKLTSRSGSCVLNTLSDFHVPAHPPVATDKPEPEPARIGTLAIGRTGQHWSVGKLIGKGWKKWTTGVKMVWKCPETKNALDWPDSSIVDIGCISLLNICSYSVNLCICWLRSLHSQCSCSLLLTTVPCSWDLNSHFMLFQWFARAAHFLQLGKAATCTLCKVHTKCTHHQTVAYIVWQEGCTHGSRTRVRTPGNERGSNGTVTTALTRRPRRRWKTQTQPVCTRGFLDNNKLMGFTSHILFMLSDGVSGSLR